MLILMDVSIYGLAALDMYDLCNTYTYNVYTLKFDVPGTRGVAISWWMVLRAVE